VNGYLLDTNVVSELRKKRRAHQKVLAWLDSVPDEDLFLSVLVLGEIRKGIELIRLRDPVQGRNLEAWLVNLETAYAERLLPITAAIADRWGRLSAIRPISTVDGLMAATALESRLTLVTRNTEDVQHTGVGMINPFS
jgi:toxin FitB